MSASYEDDPAAGENGVDAENQLQPLDTLIDQDVDDILDVGYSPPERMSGYDPLRPPAGMNQLLAQEEPDPASRINVPLDEAERRRAEAAVLEVEFPRRGEVGTQRAGRLVAPDLGVGEDTEPELVAEDVGISGGAATAEEAAVHIIEEETEDGGHG
ncbi:hypothetical protein H7I53_23610 [Mycolicibacterium pulveris]|uniref:DUF5709 domain-containing protein n=1 Tax=Mycolicibacterium pulveris TaxID=36813 RepID=A0A7I7UPW3_MYCPV|nr:DUF5709 domain-containing protein [Mycolicibacterium pulveris]MCV6983190.1 hypothetical protein [Mycolicibacterium pulveris]BBY83060.1 hypothetical protein MPUL_42180 [Mycolicibacterium pulveris]